jgi:hypothetical protein
MNRGSGASASFLRKNHTFCHPIRGSDIEKQKYGLTPSLDQTKMSTLPTPSLSHSSPAVAGHGRSSSTNRSGAQSPCRPRIGSRRPLYAASLKESSDAAPSRRTATASGEIDVMALQIPPHRTPCMTQCIPLPVQMLDPHAHDRKLTPSPSYTPDL